MYVVACNPQSIILHGVLFFQNQLLLQRSVCAMPSKADALETAFGDEVRALARVHTTARRLKGALEDRRPPLQYSDGVLKQWLMKYGPASGKATLSASDLQDQYGEVLHAEARNAPTAYKLQKALGRRQPPIEATEAALKIWFAKYHVAESYTKVVTASRLELEYGAKLRGRAGLLALEPKERTTSIEAPGVRLKLYRSSSE